MPEYPHTFRIGPAFDLEHLFTLELNESWMSQIKRYGNTWDAIWRKPLFREPDVRFESDTTHVELTVEPPDVGLEE